MAIDTTEKKLSLISFGIGGLSLPVADGSLNTGDLQHLLGLYSGISLGETIIIPERACLHVNDESRYGLVVYDAVRYDVFASDESC